MVFWDHALANSGGFSTRPLSILRRPAGRGRGYGKEKEAGRRKEGQARAEDRLARSTSFFLKSGGREGIRTPGLLIANEALSQLSYSPTSSYKILADAPRLANRSRPDDLRREITDRRRRANQF